MQTVLPWLVGGLCVFCGIVALVVRPTALVGWLFFAGMALIAAEQLLSPQMVLASRRSDVGIWLWRSMFLKSLVPGVWLCFSLVYARGDRADFLRRWRWGLVAALVVPPAILIFCSSPIVMTSGHDRGVNLPWMALGKVWVMVMLLITVGILTNLEKTFRASVGMTRWRIKYLVLGAGLIFGVKLYTLSQLLLFSGYDPALARLETIAVGLGGLLMIVGHTRASFGAFDLYPSRAVLQGSLTIILAGGYFLIVGVLAQVVAMLGGIASFPAQALVVLIGLVGLTVLLLSDRFKTSLQRFVSRHFHRAEHDFRKIWTEFTRRTSSVFDDVKLGTHAAEVISENFHVLGVTVLQAILDPPTLNWLSSTEKRRDQPSWVFSPSWLAEIEALARPFNLEKRTEAWATVLRESCPTKFDHGGDRLVIPLVAAERLVGLVILADRVNGVPYSHEEIDLLACIGDQLAAALLSSSLTEKVLQAKELEAFQTLSTFFVHDLKNAANSLNLTLQNLPVHFDDPEFRADAVKAVGRTVERINQMILKLSSLRHDLHLRLVPCRLDLLCAEVIAGLDREMQQGCLIQRDLAVVPELKLDREAMHSVVTNLLVNAREAITGDGNVRVTTRLENGKLALTVADEGSGMSAEFIRNQLFRPFHSTKTKGLGIGMFQCKKIVEAHHGSIRVDSAPGQGTRFTVLLPASPGFPTESNL